MYGTNEGFTAYHTERGRDVSGFDDAAITAARLVGSEFIDDTYGAQFSGEKVGLQAQEDQWPRNGAWDIDGYAIAADSVPDRVIRASYEAAYVQLTAPGTLVVNFTPNKYKSARVDGAVSVEYADLDAISSQTRFLNIDRIIAPLLTGTGRSDAGFSGPAIRV